MMKILKTLTIINIVIFLLRTIIGIIFKSFSAYVFIFQDYSLFCGKLEIAYYITSLAIIAFLAFKNNFKRIGIASIICCIVGIISLIMFMSSPFGYSNSAVGISNIAIIVSVVLSIIYLVIDFKGYKTKIDVKCIVLIVLSIAVVITLDTIPFIKENKLRKSFENALPTINNLPAYKAKKNEQAEYGKIILDLVDKRVRLNYENIDGKIVFYDIHNNKLFEIDDDIHEADFLNYIDIVYKIKSSPI